jgi:hypothetical protein
MRQDGSMKKQSSIPEIRSFSGPILQVLILSFLAVAYNPPHALGASPDPRPTPYTNMLYLLLSGHETAPTPTPTPTPAPTPTPTLTPTPTPAATYTPTPTPTSGASGIVRSDPPAGPEDHALLLGTMVLSGIWLVMRRKP